MEAIVTFNMRTEKAIFIEENNSTCILQKQVSFSIAFK
jgi:hypothetical protein